MTQCDHNDGISLIVTHGWLYRYVRCWQCNMKVCIGRRGKRWGLYDTQGEGLAIYRDMLARSEVDQ